MPTPSFVSGPRAWRVTMVKYRATLPASLRIWLIASRTWKSAANSPVPARRLPPGNRLPIVKNLARGAKIGRHSHPALALVGHRSQSGSRPCGRARNVPRQGLLGAADREGALDRAPHAALRCHRRTGRTCSFVPSYSKWRRTRKRPEN